MVCGISGGYPGVLVKFALISCAHAKITTRTAWVHGGALRAPPCTEAVVVVIFAWAREISANFTRTPAWLHGYPPLLPQTRIEAPNQKRCALLVRYLEFAWSVEKLMTVSNSLTYYLLRG